VLRLAITVQIECGNWNPWELFFGFNTGIYKDFSRARYLEFLARSFV